MSDGDLDIKLYGDASHVIKEQAKLIKQQEQAIETYKKLATESKKSGKEAEKAAKDAEKANAAAAKELDRFARATKDINRTPLEKYADEMLRLNRALKAGKIDQETFNRAVAKTKAEFQQAGNAGERAFGSSASSNLGRYAAQVVGVSAAASALYRILGDVRMEAEQLGQQQFIEAGSLGSLAQLSGMSQGDVARLEGEAKKTFLEGGALTMPEAVDLQKTLESGNIGEYRADMARMQSSGLAQAKPMAEAGIMMAAGFGKEETGDFRSMMSKAFGAAMLGLGEADEIYRATAKVSQQAGRLKLTDEETMAAVSTASAVVGPDEAATQIGALMKGIEVEGIGGGFLKPGKTLMEQVQEIKKLESAGEDIRVILGGRQEAVAGYGALVSSQGQETMRANLGNIATADKEQWFEKRATLAENIPTNKVAIALRRRKAAYQLSNEVEGMYENIADSMTLDMQANEKRKWGHGRIGDFTASLIGVGNSVERFFRGNEAFVNTGQHPGIADDTREAAQALKESAATLRAAADVYSNHTNAARANQAAAGGAVEAR